VESSGLSSAIRIGIEGADPKNEDEWTTLHPPRLYPIKSDFDPHIPEPLYMTYLSLIQTHFLSCFEQAYLPSDPSWFQWEHIVLRDTSSFPSARMQIDAVEQLPDWPIPYFAKTKSHARKNIWSNA